MLESSLTGTLKTKKTLQEYDLVKGRRLYNQDKKGDVNLQLCMCMYMFVF